jgi:hypothetical protein
LAGYIICLFLIAGGVLLARDRIQAALRRIRNPPAKIAAAAAVYEARLLRPDWPYLEAHLGRAVPASLRSVFSNPDVLTKGHLFGNYHLFFVPIDRAETGWEWVRPGVIPFAQSDGDPIFLVPGGASADSVHIAYHDGGGEDVLSESVEALLAGLQPA